MGPVIEDQSRRSRNISWSFIYAPNPTMPEGSLNLQAGGASPVQCWIPADDELMFTEKSDKKWHKQMWSQRRSKVQWVFAVGGPLCCILTLLSKSFSTVISTILHWRRECSVVVFKSDGSRILGAFACWCWWFLVWCRQWTNTVPLFHYIYSFIYWFIWIYVAFDNDVHTSNLFRTETWRSADLLTHTLLIVYLSRIDAHMLDTQL